MYIDRMDYYHDQTQQEKLPYENSGTHIGFFLAWIIHHHLEGEDPQLLSQGELEAVRKREMTGREFLIECCDEKFSTVDLNEEGAVFAAAYYHTEDGGYFFDYNDTLAKDWSLFFHVEDSWQNYDISNTVITKAYENWKKSKV
ncbi:hypothetical protein KKJ06_17315 [Xenorhabdus bovienii]|uniref:DUF7832 domain-containing protein n=1 Tax=Xenorhabdus bovienii TaxID=40576 RepID=UPI0023B2B2C5|nr:hypothetical protein [Xenorhabdus bovienii]MDE9557133.1 hypothetical protein [Xenorhabdus bovienii]